MTELLSHWREGLARTRQKAFGRLASVLGATEINAGTWEELEALLIQADLGATTTQDLIRSLQHIVGEQGLRRSDELRAALRQELLGRLQEPPSISWSASPQVLLIVGVNGSGKTTTIAKLVKYFLARGQSVLLGAADTFRAAAAEQLGAWAERLGVDMIAGAPESDPGAVAFNTVNAGVARGVDVIIIDTAGRLHTRSNPMEELKKVQRVVGKAMTGAPHAVWLVLDSTTGQNALAQARAFKEAVNVTGVILAKLDASARGGAALAIHRELGLPILFAGLGEGADDLVVFDREAFVAGILG
ncbi:MAG: signal recognition particle-docking protein FtsY [Chloroflexota bacterium]